MGSSDVSPTFPSRVEHHGAGHVIRIGREDALGVGCSSISPTARMGSVHIREWIYGHGLLAILGVLTDTPCVFPSLDPTAYLLFFGPLGTLSSPRNAILDHAIGLLCGVFVGVATCWRVAIDAPRTLSDPRLVSCSHCHTSALGALS